MTTNNVFSDRLTAVREERGIKRQKAADDLGITRASLEYYEKGMRKPDTEMLLRICKYYKISADYLLGLSNAQITATDDKQLKTVCDYTGLNELSVKTLHEIEEYRLLSVFNKLLNNYILVDMANAAAEYWQKLGRINEYIKSALEDDGIQELVYHSLDEMKRECEYCLSSEMAHVEVLITKMADNRLKEYNRLYEIAKKKYNPKDSVYELELQEDDIIRFDNSD